MFSYFSALISHFFQYFIENLKTLIYGLEVISHKHLIHISYYDLLVDISEGFGVWMVILILVTSSLLTLTLIHSMTSPSGSTLKGTNVDHTKLSTSKSILYKTFSRFKTFTTSKL
jgi:hypothetical protein